MFPFNPDFSIGQEPGGAPGLGPHVQRRVQVQPQHLPGKVGLHQPDAPLLHAAPHATRAGYILSSIMSTLTRSEGCVNLAQIQLRDSPNLGINRTNEVIF